jgi:hypothetical protein
MPTINDLKQFKYLTKADVTPPVLVTIRSYEQVNVAKEGAEPEMRWALLFDELDKPAIVNSTNGQIIAAITKSEDFDGWIGHKIVLFNDPNISFGGKLTGGIRCRAPRNQSAQTAPAPSAAPAKANPAPVVEAAEQEAGDSWVPF